MAELTQVWLVRNPTKDSLRQEIVHEWPVDRLPTLIIGTTVETWRAENTKLYTDEASATKDAKKRWEKMHGKGSWDKTDATQEVRTIIQRAERL